jgi:hypothetical protein
MNAAETTSFWEKLDGSKNLVDRQVVLGEPIRKLTKQLVDPRLTEERKIAAIDQAAVALCLHHSPSVMRAT